jgi:hypothetical protein
LIFSHQELPPSDRPKGARLAIWVNWFGLGPTAFSDYFVEKSSRLGSLLFWLDAAVA